MDCPCTGLLQAWISHLKQYVTFLKNFSFIEFFMQTTNKVLCAELVLICLAWLVYVQFMIYKDILSCSVKSKFHSSKLDLNFIHDLDIIHNNTWQNFTRQRATCFILELKISMQEHFSLKSLIYRELPNLNTNSYGTVPYRRQPIFWIICVSFQ